jgi:hypothetical protein
MGCWNIFCCICGNTCYSLSKDELLEDFINVEISENNINEIVKQSKWLNNCTLLLKNNKIIHNCKEISCNIGFKSIKTNKYYETLNVFTNNNINFEQYNLNSKNFIENIGIFIHTDCWKFIKKNYNIKLEYKDLPIYLNKKNINSYLPINYNQISNYWDQSFNYLKMYLDNNIYMIQSPLKNNIKNINRIKKIINQIKLKPNRTGPSVSATFYNKNDIKLGNNNKFWKISNGKWIEINEDVIIKKITINTNNKYIKNLNKIPQIGEVNNETIFIKDYEFNKKNKSIDIVFIGTMNIFNAHSTPIMSILQSI